MTKWSRESIAAEIVAMNQVGACMTHGAVARSNTALLRAATRVFGSWEAAIVFAGLDYDAIRAYRSWTRERIVERIRELFADGADLSWSNVADNVDPQLASAACKRGHFGSWRRAVEAAGLDYDAIRRYRAWDQERVLTLVREHHADGTQLNAKNMQEEDLTLLTAARRKFESWPAALAAAGLDYREIVQRTPFRRGLGRNQGVRLRDADATLVGAMASRRSDV